MDDGTQQTLNEYTDQLKRVDEALLVTENEEDRNNLLSLKNDLQQLIDLSRSTGGPSSSGDGPPTSNDPVDDEYALFMAEMQKEGAIESHKDDDDANSIDLSTLEGMKCRAPHVHTWGDTVHHNALISSVLPHSSSSYETLQVKVLFTNPTHKEMLPCPYYLDTECRFSEDKCRFSHGEVVLFSTLQEYIEPDFAGLNIGTFVLVKQDDRLWHRGIVRKMLKDKQMCYVKLDKAKDEIEVQLSDLHPIADDGGDNDDTLSSDSELEVDEESRQDFINVSLLITPTDEKMGSWEKHTKGIGSKLMQKMGYVIGTGLGSRAQGRIEPVTAVALPAGKSLDRCMELREQAGGDTNLFSVERKLKRLQRKQEQRNVKNYERERKKVDVFNFLNDTIKQCKKTEQQDREVIQLSKTQHRKEIKKESARNLNVESFKIEHRIKEIQGDMLKITQAMQRHTSTQASQLRKQLDDKHKVKREELLGLENKLQNIKNEQSLRNTTRKLTIF